jgi:acetylornithine deacetylase
MERWTHDPWGADIVDGRMYGRGSSDMKSALLASYFALKSILAAGLRPRGKVILESVIEEEIGGSGGSLACRLRGHLADGAIVTEPMELALFLAHAGVYLFRVRIKGKSTHAVFSHEGVSAIDKAMKVYQALKDLDLRRAKEHYFPLLADASGRSCNLLVGILKAGDWYGTLPGFAQMEGRVGFVPGEKGEDVKHEVEEAVRSACAGDPWLEEHPPEVEWFGMHTEPWLQDENHPLVRMFQTCVEMITARAPEIGGGRGSLDNRIFSYFDIPSLCYGPKGGNGHGVDEWADLESVVTTTKVLALAILDWCGYERP